MTAASAVRSARVSTSRAPASPPKGTITARQMPGILPSVPLDRRGRPLIGRTDALAAIQDATPARSPKSRTFTAPLRRSMMFEGVTSRWTTLSFRAVHARQGVRYADPSPQLRDVRGDGRQHQLFTARSAFITAARSLPRRYSIARKYVPWIWPKS